MLKTWLSKLRAFYVSGCFAHPDRVTVLGAVTLRNASKQRENNWTGLCTDCGADARPVCVVKLVSEDALPFPSIDRAICGTSLPANLNSVSHAQPTLTEQCSAVASHTIESRLMPLLSSALPNHLRHRCP